MPIDATNPVPPELPRVAGMDNVPDHEPIYIIRNSGISFGPEFLESPHEYMSKLH